jgi:hypothetical protein
MRLLLIFCERGDHIETAAFGSYSAVNKGSLDRGNSSLSRVRERVARSVG